MRGSLSWLPQALALPGRTGPCSGQQRVNTARCVHDPGWGPYAGPGGGEAGPLACLPDAVLAEAVIVAEDDDFARHGGTDAEAILNLEGHGGEGAQERERVTSMNRRNRSSA